MRRTSLHSPDPDSARRRIAAGKSDKPFMAALLDRGHRGHGDAVEQWTRLHEAAFPGASVISADRRPDPTRVDPASARTISVSGRGAANDRASIARGQAQRRPIKNRFQDANHGDRPAASVSVPDGRDDLEPPVVNNEADRIRAIIENAPARFEIAEDSDANPNFGAGRSLHRLGWNAVRRHEAIIVREAEAQGVDADLVRAIMYVENAQSLDSQAAEATGLGESESLLPMNIRPDPWAAIEDPPADLGDPATNIRIAVTLIRRISERVDDPTPAKVASIWNFTGRELVNDFGARVRDAYERRLWALPVVPTPELELSP